VAPGIASGTTGSMLGDDRLNLFGDVFDNARAFVLTTLQRTAATGAAFQAMGFSLIDPLGRLAPMARVTFLGTWLLASPGRIGLGVNGHHARRCRWGGWLRLGRPLQLGDALAGREQGKCENFGVLIGQPSGLCFGERAAYHRLDQTLCRLSVTSRRRHVRMNKRAWRRAQVTYLNIFGDCAALQTADLLR
jgi:hypothetical protein